MKQPVPKKDSASDAFADITDDPTGETRRRIEALALLTDDWDGADAPAIAAETLRRAQELLAAMHGEAQQGGRKWRNPDVAPTPHGGVYLHWDSDALPFSAIVTQETAETTLLVGTGKGRAQRFEAPPAKVAVAIADLLMAQTDLEELHRYAG